LGGLLKKRGVKKLREDDLRVELKTLKNTSGVEKAGGFKNTRLNGNGDVGK